MPGLARAVATVVRRCLAVAPGEAVVVATDETLRELGEALRREAQEAGGEAVMTVMAPRADDGNEPPAAVAAALAACDVYIAPTSRSLSHTEARRVATERGARGASLPHVTAEMLERLMTGDFDAMRARSRAVAALLDDAAEAHVTCPRGTDLRVDLAARRGIADDGELTARGAFGNLPCGEGYVAPAGGEGSVAVRSIGALGVVAGHPARLTIENGRMVRAAGLEGEALASLLTTYGDAGRNLAELGVGTNERARLSGNILEDEKILGTVHVAFGASAAIGGNVSVPVHVDAVVTDATLVVEGTVVLDGGRYVL